MSHEDILRRVFQVEKIRNVNILKKKHPSYIQKAGRWARITEKERKKGH